LTKSQVTPKYRIVGTKRIQYPGSIIDNGNAEKYFEFYETRMKNHYLRAVASILKERGYEGRVLDIGCGAGVFGVILCDKTEYFDVVGLERSGTLVRISEAISSRFGYGKRISPRTWVDQSLPFPDGEFDAVVSLFSMHRWGDCENILSEIDRVRKKDGFVHITDFRRDFTFPPFSVYAARNGLAAGGEIYRDLINSRNSAYTTREISSILESLGLSHWRLKKRGHFMTVSSSAEDIVSKVSGQQ